MKRTLLTGLSILVGAAIGAGLLHVDLEPTAFAEPRSPRRHASPTPFHPFTPGAQKKSSAVKVVPRIVYQAIQLENSEVDQRLVELSGLMQQKVERMSDEELDMAIKDLKAELDAQNKAADSELQNAIDILERLVEQSTGTPAAERARLALSILKGQMPQPPPTEPTPLRTFPPSPPAESAPTY